MASLYLNLGDASMKVGDYETALEAAEGARSSLLSIPAGGYRDFIEYGICRLRQRLGSGDGAQLI